MLSRVLLAVSILVAFSAQGPGGHRYVDLLSTCYNVCLHQDEWCAEHGAKFKMDCKKIHDECVFLCVERFPGQNADFPTIKAPLPLDSLPIKNSDIAAQKEQAKEDL
ncbi:hypothetical protein MVEG_06374 [Podila verticillata NRRL 6337]|nr:hypothetical protein MVEG_06374 [Podila verticillata NRRL 6337]